MWQWAYHDSRTPCSTPDDVELTIGFLAGSADRLRGLKNTSENPSATEKRDALLVFPLKTRKLRKLSRRPSPHPTRQRSHRVVHVSDARRAD